MKNLFKKNQIIVTALALMIAVAGYLNFTRDQADLDEAARLASESDYLLGSVGNMAGMTDADDELADAAALENQMAGDTDEFADIFDEDAAETAQIPVSDTGDLLVDTSSDDSAGVDTAGDDAEIDDTAADGSVSDDPASDDPQSDVYTEDTQGEEAEGNPGDAVLASTVLDSGYFAPAKLAREQTRAKNKEALMELISNTDITEEQKQEAIDTMIDLTAIAEKENAAEMLLEAKGFADVVVRILDESVDVVVNAAEITDQQVAQIEDIVMRKTGAEASDIVITSVITGE